MDNNADVVVSAGVQVSEEDCVEEGKEAGVADRQTRRKMSLANAFMESRRVTLSIPRLYFFCCVIKFVIVVLTGILVLCFAMRKKQSKASLKHERWKLGMKRASS